MSIGSSNIDRDTANLSFFQEGRKCTDQRDPTYSTIDG